MLRSRAMSAAGSATAFAAVRNLSARILLARLFEFGRSWRNEVS
jgi:hypothetical protein